jgi:two-component system nitrate/nitrite sensor histidine kinase NarX
VDICLDFDKEQVRLEIKDHGRGIREERLDQLTDGRTGVGIAGMRERARELGGRLEIQSDETGTRVIVTIPVSTDLSRFSTG